MRVLFQGAGAIGIAGAALFGDRHEAVVVSRSASSTPEGAYPRRVRTFGRGVSFIGNRRGASNVRRVPVIDWTAASASKWDLVVLTTRPGDLDENVTTSLSRLRPGIIAITSQVDGDRGVAKSMFPRAQIVVFSPTLLSERTTGRSVRYWNSPGMPVFMASGPHETLRRLRGELGSLVVGVPAAAIFGPPAVFIPYVAELSIRAGSWTDLKKHLRRPTRAATEAVHSVTGIRMPMSASVAGLVLEALERFVPIDVSEYAGRHFGRHEGQTLDMLDGWSAREPEGSIGQTTSRVTAPARSRSPADRSAAPALRELAQSLRLRVTR